MYTDFSQVNFVPLQSDNTPRLSPPKQSFSTPKTSSSNLPNTAANNRNFESELIADSGNPSLPKITGNEQSPSANVLSKERNIQEKNYPSSDLENLNEAITQKKNLLRLGNGQDILNSIPILAFLTGRLEQIDPSAIPRLLTHNSFMEKALSIDDIPGFLNEVQPVQKLLENLGIEEKFWEKIEKAGIDLNSQMSPNELFTRLGINSNRVAIELGLLKNNLPLEGASGYIQRAQRLNSNKNRPKDLVTLDKIEKEKSTPANKGTIGNEPNLGAGSEDDSESNNLNEVLNKNNKDFSQPDIAREKIQANGAASSRDFSKKDMQPTTTFAEAKPLVVSAAASKVDPYQTMGNELKNSEVKSYNLRQQIEQLPSVVNEQVVIAQEIIRPPEDEIRSHVLAAKNQDVGDSSSQDMLLAGGSKPSTNISLQPIQNMAVGNEKVNIVTTKIPVMELQINLNKDPAKTDDEIRKQDKEVVSQKMESLDRSAVVTGLPGTEILTKNENTGPSFVSQLKGEPNVFEQAVRKNINEQIVNHASLLVKDGGGAIRINLGNPESGRIDLAVRVHHDTVDMRILTDNNSIRDILGNDLPKLKEALSAQNLQLNNVELGVGMGHKQAGEQQMAQYYNNESLRNSWDDLKPSSSPRAIKDVAKLGSKRLSWAEMAMRGPQRIFSNQNRIAVMV